MPSGLERRWSRNMTTFSSKPTLKARKSLPSMASYFRRNISASSQALLSASGRALGCTRAGKLRMLARSSRKRLIHCKSMILIHHYSVVFATLIAASAISTIAPQINAFTNASAAASELFSVLDKQSELDPLDESGKIPDDSCYGRIEITNLSFAYPSRPGASVLRDFNLSIPAGKTTALVGASGSGKSTVVGLLERWYSPSSGSIMLDGIDLSEYNIQWLRSRIRLVQQVRCLYIL